MRECCFHQSERGDADVGEIRIIKNGKFRMKTILKGEEEKEENYGNNVSDSFNAWNDYSNFCECNTVIETELLYN